MRAIHVPTPFFMAWGSPAAHEAEPNEGPIENKRLSDSWDPVPAARRGQETSLMAKNMAQNRPLAVRDSKLETGKSKLETRNSKIETGNWKLEIRNPESAKCAPASKPKVSIFHFRISVSNFEF